MNRRLFALIVLAAALVTSIRVLSLDIADRAEPADRRPAAGSPPAENGRGETAAPVRALVARVRVGEARACDGLRVYELTLPGAFLRADLATLDEALAAKTLTITEQGSGNVPVLLATNAGKRPVYLMAGEMILGGKQNRLVRQDVIVPPGARDLEVPVYCGQQGRWSVTSPTFESKSSIANQAVRKSILGGSDQGTVWKGIEENLRANAVAESSGALQAAYDDKEVARRVDRMADQCAPRAKSAVGLAVTRGGRVIGADLFGDPALLRALGEKILRGYAVEVYDGKPWPADDGREREAVLRFLSDLGDARMSRMATPGMGQAFEVDTGSARGGAMTLAGEAVHVAAMP
jgi:hypothetical protein